MAGNSFGKNFTLTTFGESHGPAYGCILDGCPPLLNLTESDIQKELDRRRPGTSPFTSQRREADKIQILSGVFNGKTTGTPIGLLILNEDARTSDYQAIKNKFRPGHADFTYQHKYGIRDYRGGGRASARETVMRVAAGAIAKKYLWEHYAIKITAYLAQIGILSLDCKDAAEIENNPFFCADPAKITAIEDCIKHLRKTQDSVGARINVFTTALPIGLGQPVFDKFNACLAHALMSINAVKGVEIGDGFACISQKGSQYRDALTQTGFSSNHDGGILGGISNGQALRASVAFKPTSSIPQSIQTLTVNNEITEISTLGRHDPCVGIRAVPIVEAMVALTIIDLLLQAKAQDCL